MLNIKRISFISFAFLAVAILTAQSASAQLRLPRPSQSASVKQTIGVTDVSIVYSRPGVKGRTIWGEWPAEVKGEGTLDNQNTRPKDAPIVPNGHLWRTGANDATQFVITDDVLINGQPLPAGSYSLHTIPGKDEWTVVFNGTANQWGSFSYDPAKDTLRVKAKPQWLADSQEWMAFTIDPAADNSATVAIRWEKIRVPFTVEVKNVPAIALAKARIAVAAAKPDDWAVPYQAAMYAKTNKADADAARWFEQSLKILDEQIKTKETFQNLTRKSTVLLGSGRKDEALVVAEKALVIGKAEKADTAQLEKRIADIKAGKL